MRLLILFNSSYCTTNFILFLKQVFYLFSSNSFEQLTAKDSASNYYCFYEYPSEMKIYFILLKFRNMSS